MPYVAPALRVERRLVALLGRWLLIVLLLPAGGFAQENPNKVKAAFLRNFAHYVNWPDHALAEDTTSWRIGILGPDPFGDVLEAVFEGRTEQGRPFEVFRADRPEQLPPCHIVFVAYGDAARRRAGLAALKNKPVLTVGDGLEFLQDGGIIGFQVADRVKMSVNLDQARAVALTIQTKMLEVSADILENGVLRRMR